VAVESIARRYVGIIDGVKLKKSGEGSRDFLVFRGDATIEELCFPACQIKGL
jgi:hypothetical protein